MTMRRRRLIRLDDKLDTDLVLLYRRAGFERISHYIRHLLREGIGRDKKKFRRG